MLAGSILITHQSTTALELREKGDGALNRSMQITKTMHVSRSIGFNVGADSPAQ
jgi:hypothetical protein